jgi:hypothetical protein
MRAKAEAAQAVPTTFATPAKRSISDLLTDEKELKVSGERIAGDDLYSPNTKEQLQAAIKLPRKALIKEAITSSHQESSSTTPAPMTHAPPNTYQNARNE